MLRPVIYMLTTTKSPKVYVGQTRQGGLQRWREHVCRSNLSERDHKLYLAMRKHGVSTFEMREICSALKPEFLDDLERHFIAEFNSFQRGYNMTCGGDSVSDETRAKLSAIFKGRKITWSDKIVASRRANPMKQAPREDRGAASKMAKAYLVRLPSGETETINGLRAFCRQNGLSHNLMLDTLKGRQNHHKGYTLLARLNDYPAREYGQVA